MFISVCGIFDVDKEYASQLVRLLKERRTLPCDVVAFTGMDALKSYVSRKDVDILIVDDDMDLSECSLSDDVKVIRLTEVLTDDRDKIYKYQDVNEIIGQLLRIAGKTSLKTQKNACRMLGVFSPLGGCGKTAFALNMAYELAKEQRVLFIDLEEFSGLGACLKKESTGDFSDVMYYFLEGEDDIVGRLKSSVFTYNGTDILETCACKEDIEDIRMNDVIACLMKLSDSGEYDCIVLDIGNAIREEWMLFNVLDGVYVTEQNSALAQERLRELYAFLKKVMGDMETDKIKNVNIKYNSDEEAEVIQGNNVKFRDYVRGVLYG